MKPNYLLYAIAIVLFNCNSNEKSTENQFIGSWKVSSEKTSENNVVSETEQSSLIHFYPDSTFTEQVNLTITQGKWTYSNESGISYGDKTLIIKNINDVEPKRIMMANLVEDNAKTELRLIENSAKLKDYRTDPFYPENIKWKSHPQGKESNEEIRTRLSNYILHNAYLLKAAHDRNSGSVSFQHSKGIIKVFRGGVGIVGEDQVKDSWVNCFYDEEDAMKAYYLYSSYLDKQGVSRIKSSGDWVFDDYNALMNLHSQIKEKSKADIESFTTSYAKL